MKLTIENCRNGYIVASNNGEDPAYAQVFQHDEDIDGDKTEAKALREMLYYILEEIGYSPSRYSTERVYIELKPGDKYEIGKE